MGVRQYEYCGRPTLPLRTTKVERLLSAEDINLVSSNLCCKRNCVQPFPRKKILALQNQMWRDSDCSLKSILSKKQPREYYSGKVLLGKARLAMVCCNKGHL
jgi:hypothetical protein